MKPSSSMTASPNVMPASVRQLQWLLFSLLMCGFLLSLPSQASTPHPIESGRADHLFTDASFIVATNDLLRAIRSDGGKPCNDTSGDLPLAGLPADTFHLSILSASISASAASVFLPLPVNHFPGAPRGPPVVPR